MLNASSRINALECCELVHKTLDEKRRIKVLTYFCDSIRHENLTLRLVRYGEVTTSFFSVLK